MVLLAIWLIVSPQIALSPDARITAARMRSVDFTPLMVREPLKTHEPTLVSSNHSSLPSKNTSDITNSGAQVKREIAPVS